MWSTNAEVMPWVGLYICVASLVCTLAMAADAFRGFQQRKLWFPCKFFTINAASITLIAISTKLPVDLSTDMTRNDYDLEAKFVSIFFLVIMLANFLPSLGLMSDKELLLNTVALCILVLTVTVNMLVQLIIAATSIYFYSFIVILITFFLILAIPWTLSVAFSVPASRRVLQQRYKELHGLAQVMNFSGKVLIRYVKKYWMIAETGNPQFVIACSPVSSAFGVICSLLALISVSLLIVKFQDKINFWNNGSDYNWSINGIIILQSIGAIVGSIAPIFRCLTATTHFNLSKTWSKNHINVFRVEKLWVQTLQLWKSSPVPSRVPGRHCKKVFHKIRKMVLNFCIALQMMNVVICNMISVIPRFLLILVTYCYHFGKSFLKRFKEEPNASNGNVISDMEEYSGYVLQIEPDAKLSKRILQNALNSITQLLHESEEKEPVNLVNLLKKSKGFNGVVEFDNHQVPPLHQQENQNCWSLVAATLTAIALALPKISNAHIKGLLSGVSEGLEFVTHIEQCLNENDDLVKARKAATRAWTDIEVYCKWLQIDLQKKARKRKTSEEILQWLGDEAVKIVIQFKRRKHVSLDHSLRKFIAASSMYRVSQSILLHCNEQEHWPTDEELFEYISTIIADLLCACFTNLPRVITMKCHHDAIEKREDSIRIAAQLLGRSKKILKMLKARQLPNLDMESMAYIDNWHALPKSHIPNGSATIQPASSSSNESVVVTII